MDICGGMICSYLIISDPFGFLKRVTKMFVKKHHHTTLYSPFVEKKTSYVYGNVIL